MNIWFAHLLGYFVELKSCSDWIMRQYVYAHHWQVGDLVMWDNTSTVHRGRWFDYAERRELRRATTEEVSA